ncbi:trimeric intracellular cation channel family protein [Telmatocola sphagniphila]|uniref:Trimeric intracellular cation channel family protein n=1 Tax=Telmatocola sphagniphila TaxID=1123043 RepID=A0A8E6B2U1_9BACT|nr:trimeric intracellular cation channel family protein [Telmatocola sphagniphila]QVL30389.1 trimeric intracellular cation channel family protein [Telmatocola sphagniphila]
MTILRIMEISGVSIAAISSVLIAGRKNLDLMGVMVIAIVTSVGGGTIRDLLLNRHPIFWVENPIFLYVIILSALLTLIYVRIWPPPQKLLLTGDGLSLAVFTIVGVQITEQAGHGGILAAMMGVVTGCAGGIIRDVMTNEIPLVMRGGRLYATAALVGATLYLGLQAAGMDSHIASGLGIVTVGGLRFAAIIWGIGLPLFHIEENGQGRLSRYRKRRSDRLEDDEESKFAA